MKIGEAMEVMRAGGRVCRHGWNGRDMWIALQEPDAHTKMSLPYVYMRTAQGGTVPQDDERAVRAWRVTLGERDDDDTR
jgi:Protein of unknown function (DUF2829)